MGLEFRDPPAPVDGFRAQSFGVKALGPGSSGGL